MVGGLQPGEGKWHNLCLFGTVNRSPVSSLYMLCDACPRPLQGASGQELSQRCQDTIYLL